MAWLAQGGYGRVPLESFLLLAGATAHSSTKTPCDQRVCFVIVCIWAASLLYEALLINAHGPLTFDRCP